MSATTDTKIEHGTIEHLDFTPACELSTGCGNTAAWRFVATLKCCGIPRDLLFCASHHDYFTTTVRVWHCVWCGVKFFGAHWEGFTNYSWARLP